MANPQLTLTRYDIWNLNNGKISAFPVTNPPGWDDISLYYAKALKAMGWQQSPAGNTDVTSMWPYSQTPNTYFFQAAMHWYPLDSPAPLPSWNHCTHEQSPPGQPMLIEQYFLPWHRAYIYFFEVIVRSYVAQLGGPGTWALPYWNYSYYDDSNPSAPGAPWVRSSLPWVFSQAQLPDGSDNPLYMADIAKRGLQPNWPQNDTGDQGTMFLEPSTPDYDNAYGQTDFVQFSQTLDVAGPHGAVHVDTGTGDQVVSGGGWMTNPMTAAYDPVFWLHHAQIDRFWVGWNQAKASNENPSDSTWMNAQDDPSHDTRWDFWADGNIANKLVVYPGQMVNPASLGDPFPYSYGYQNLPTFPAPPNPGSQARAEAAPELAALSAAAGGPRPASAAAAVAGGDAVELGREPVTASVPVPELAQAAAAHLAELPAAAEPPHVILQLEGITSDGPPGNYLIYLNYPQADRTTAGAVPHYVGLLAGFGADHHHGPAGAGDDQGQHGLNASYDITAIVAYLRTHGGWDEAQARITFVPASRPRPGFELKTAGLRIASITIETA